MLRALYLNLEDFKLGKSGGQKEKNERERERIIAAE